MIKTLNLKFTEEEHKNLKNHKQELKKVLNLTRLSWEKYFKILNKEVLVWDKLEDK